MSDATTPDLPGQDYESLIDVLEDQVFAQRVDEAMEVCSWLADEILSERNKHRKDLTLVDLLRKTSRHLARFKNNHL